MEWEIGQLMGAYDIYADGGPWPDTGETQGEYNVRVLEWAKTMGYKVKINENGIPVFMGLRGALSGKLPAFLCAGILGTVIIVGARKKN